MCEPATLTLIATGVAAAGTMVGGLMKASQQRYAAAVSYQNAKLAAAQAADASKRGQLEEQRSYNRTAQLLGQQRAAMAANGIEVDFGSASDVQADTHNLGRDEAATIRQNTEREMRGYDIEGLNYQTQARADRAAASGSIVSSLFNTAGTILGGVSQANKQRAAASGGGTNFGG